MLTALTLHANQRLGAISVADDPARVSRVRRHYDAVGHDIHGIDELYPFEIRAPADEYALREDSVALCSHLRTVSIEHRIVAVIGPSPFARSPIFESQHLDGEGVVDPRDVEISVSHDEALTECLRGASDKCVPCGERIATSLEVGLE